jgi:hypothetical protein
VRGAAAGDGLPHQLARSEEDTAELIVRKVGDAAPGIEAGGEASLALEDVADAGDHGLVEQGVADGPGGIGPEAAQNGLEVELLGE